MTEQETVLIVDDNPINLRVIANCLSKAGYKVLAADDGWTAIDLISKSKPNIVLLDVMMPGIDGYETCAMLKAKKETSDIPVLFLTARSETADKIKGFQSGGADYITKPYQEAEVLARVRAHLTISSQRKKLEIMLAERERFMKIAAHDLRNPLAVILFLASMENAEMPQEKAFAHITKAARQMKGIIDDFLSLQISQTADPAGARAFKLDEIIEQVIEQQKLAAKTKGITLHLDTFRGQAPALGNPAHAHQILTNYVSNAIKYSPHDSEVTLSAVQSGAVWRIEIKDQGPGVPESERGQLFVEFGRISNKPTGGETSTKLGLSVVKRLAQAQAGMVGAYFPKTGGSVFWVELPAETQSN